MNWEYSTYEYGLSAVLLTSAMFGMGATLEVKDFGRVFKSPKGLFLIITMQIVVMPFVAVLLAKLFSLPPEIVVGMVLIAALPGGLFSNLVTYIGKGNVALSVSATAVTSMGCLMTTVFVLKIFSAADLPADFSMPATAILIEVGLCLLLPLFLGMVFHRLAPQASPKVSSWCVRASVVLLLLIVVAALTAGRLDLAAYGWKIPLALIVFALIALWLTYGMAVLIRLNVDDSFTVAIEVLMRNAHLGLLLKAVLFPSSDSQHLDIADGVLYTLFLYGAISLVISGSEICGKYKKLGPIFGRSQKREPT